jgi:hypothetical protein
MKVDAERYASEYDAGITGSSWKGHGMKLRSCLLKFNPVECFPQLSNLSQL